MRKTRASNFLETRRKYEAIVKAMEPKLLYTSDLFKAQVAILETGQVHLEMSGVASTKEVAELVRWLYDVFIKELKES